MVILLGIPPFIFYILKKPSWDQRTKEKKEENVEKGKETLEKEIKKLRI